MRVIVGMSGGVDSSVAAYLLKEEGYEVEGVSFILEERRLKSGVPVSTCCSVESVLDARKTADLIGISHSLVNLRNEFSENVIEPFITAYSAGVTPNPCILCNEHIKFTYLRSTADDRGAGFFATGHYARVMAVTGQRVLGKGIDDRKDQSYVLYMLKQDLLDRLVLPLGGMRKDEVREIAGRLGLPSAKRPESQEICFVGGRNYFTFLEGLAADTNGQIMEWGTERVLGEHKGVHLYTIGQRKRLGIAAGKPLYVVRIDPLRNIVYVGPREAALVREFAAGDIRLRDPGILSMGKRAGEGPRELRATVKVRSTMKDEPAVIVFHSDGTARVIFDEPQWAPAPGQSAVFYDGDRVIGGGVIRECKIEK